MAKSSRWNRRFKIRILLEGYNAEQAVRKLQREKIPVFSLERRDKKSILFTIYRKDFQKAFTFFKDSCYNETDRVYRNGFCIRKTYPVGLYRLALLFKRHVGFLLGSLLFFLSATFSQGFVLSVRLTGDGEAYRKEAIALLCEEGVSPFRWYPKEKVPLLTAKLLSLPNVSFVSLNKEGYALTVRLVKSESETVFTPSDILSPASGEVLSLTVLSGLSQVKVGDRVEKDQLLVRAARTLSDGTELPTLAMAKITLLTSEERYFFTEEEALLYYECLYGAQADYTLERKGETVRLQVLRAETYYYSMQE